MIRLDGFCPMGCGRTLYAEEGRAFGQIICMGSGCPGPMSAQEILNDPETRHIVKFGGNGFTIRHPLHERNDDAMMSCDLHLICFSMPCSPDGETGTFRAFEEDGTWRFERKEEGPDGQDEAG